MALKLAVLFKNGSRSELATLSLNVSGGGAVRWIRLAVVRAMVGGEDYRALS